MFVSVMLEGNQKQRVFATLRCILYNFQLNCKSMELNLQNTIGYHLKMGLFYVKYLRTFSYQPASPSQCNNCKL